VGELRNPSDLARHGLKAEEGKNDQNEKEPDSCGYSSSSSSDEDGDDGQHEIKPAPTPKQHHQPASNGDRARLLRFHAEPAGVRVERIASKGGGFQVKETSSATATSKEAVPPWEAVLWRGRLYALVGERQLCEGSRRAFVDLLEYAEDELGCSHVVVCLDHQQDSGGDWRNRDLIKHFLFFGFQLLAPGHELLPPTSNANMVARRAE